MEALKRLLRPERHCLRPTWQTRKRLYLTTRKGLKPVLRIRIQEAQIHVDPDPLIIGMDPDPSIIQQK